MAPDRSRTILVVRRLDCGKICVERRLHVHDQLPSIRHADDHVRPQCAFLSLHDHLLCEVAVLDHAGEFRKAAQGHLAPLAADLGPAQRGHEAARLALQRLLPECYVLDGIAQRAEALGTLFLDARDLLVRAGERVAQRGHHRRDRFLALGETVHRSFLLLAQHLSRELQENLAVVAQRVPCDRVEAGTQPSERKLQCLLALAADVRGGPDLGTCDGELELERVRPAAADEPADPECDDDDHRDQGDERQRLVGHLRSPEALAAAAPTHSSNSPGSAMIPVGCQPAGSSSAEM